MLLLQLACAGSLFGCTSAAPSNTMHAVRTDRPPALDARDDDPAWRPAAATSAFRQWTPRDVAAPSFRTEFRVVYDTRNLYVLVRAFDPHPDSIARIVTR